METVGYLIRIELRQRWRWLCALMLVIGLAGATVVALAVGANRTESAATRLFAVSNPADAIVFGYDRGVDFPTLKEVPGVAAVTRVPFTDLLFEGIDADYGSYIVDNPEYGRTLENGPVIRGRMFDPSAFDEVVVDEAFVAATGLDVGDTGTVQLPTKAELLRAYEGDSGSEKMTGPRVTLTIVGVQRTPLISIDESSTFAANLVATPALLKKYEANLTADGVIPSSAVVWLEPDVTVEALTPLAQANGLVATSTLRVAESITGAARLQANALRAVSLIAAIAALVLIGLLVGREVRVSISRSRRLRGLGIDSRDRVRAAVGGVSIAALLGAVLTVLGAYALSDRFPVGIAVPLEPTPGRELDALLAVGAMATLLLIVLSALTAAWRAVRLEDRLAESEVRAKAWRVPLPLTAHLAVQSAVAPSRRMRPGVLMLWAGTSMAVLALVATITLAAGIGVLNDNPRAWGQTFPVIVQLVGDDEPRSQAYLAAVRADPDVARVWDVRARDLEAASGGTVTVVAPAEPDEGLPAVVLAGRLPKGPDEIAAAPAALDRVGGRLGESLTLDTEFGAKEFSVVGVALVDPEGSRSFDDGALLTGSGFDGVKQGPPDYRYAAVALNPGIDPKAWAESTRSSDAFSAFAVNTPAAVGNVLRIQSTPYLLAGLLGLLAAAAAALGLATQGRSASGMHAVLRALGLRRRQSFSVLPQSAFFVSVVSVLIFVPLGVLLGRWVWRWLSAEQNFSYIAPETGSQLAIVASLVVAVAVLLSLVPALLLSQNNLARALRRE